MSTFEFMGHKINRLIIGDNMFTGHSYIDPIVTRADCLSQYGTFNQMYETYFKLEEAGYDCALPLATDFNVHVLQEYRRDGGKMNFIFQSNSAMLFEPQARMIEPLDPIGMYVSGTFTDGRFEKGDIKGIMEAIAKCKDILQRPVGLGSHYSGQIELADNMDWGADFYVTCLHNLRRGRVGEESGFITGKSKLGVKFFREDRKIMLNMIQRVKKPCIAFKIFAGGNLLLHDDEAQVREAVRDVFREVYSNIKPTDIAAIGVFNKYKDQYAEDLELFNEVMAELEANK